MAATYQKSMAYCVCVCGNQTLKSMWYSASQSAVCQCEEKLKQRKRISQRKRENRPRACLLVAGYAEKLSAALESWRRWRSWRRNVVSLKMRRAAKPGLACAAAWLRAQRKHGENSVASSNPKWLLNT